MSKENLGNQLNELLGFAISALFHQGKNAQLTYSAYDQTVKKIQSEDLEKYTLTYPIGFNPDKTLMLDDSIYEKDDLLTQYNYLANTQLTINGIYHLVIIIEAVLSDILRKIILKYPQKIGNKRSIKSSAILSSSSIEELHMKTADSILNELSYKSPKEFSQECEELISINLLECPAYHKYIEIKATRDIYIHNLGVVNELYISKVESHTRGSIGETLPMTTQYFLESYEECIKLIEWLEVKLHGVWHSSQYEDRQTAEIAEQVATQETVGETQDTVS